MDLRVHIPQKTEHSMRETATATDHPRFRRRAHPSRRSCRARRSATDSHRCRHL